jgi:uncharacterized protein (DUF1330 family)
MTQPGYLLVVGHSLDRDKMARYSAALPPIYKAHKGHYLGIGGPGRGVELLEGEWKGHSAVLAHFPSRPPVSAFWNSKEYTEAKKLRRDGGIFDVFALEGQAAPPANAGAYVLTFAKVHDAAGYRQAMTTEADLVAAAQLAYLVRAEPKAIERLEGSGDYWVSAIVAPSPTAARSFWDSAAHRAMRIRRARAADVNALLVTATPPS